VATLDGVAPALANAFLQLQAAAAQAGFSLGIASGYRSYDQQVALRRAHCGSSHYDIYSKPASQCSPPTAVPGKSNHNHGLAIDISGTKAAKAWANANGAKFGLHFPVSGEDWHVELIGGGDHAGHGHGAQSMGAIGFDVNRMDKPQDPLDMIGQYMDAMVGAQRDELTATPMSDVLSPAMPPEIETPALAEDFTPANVAAQQLRQVTTTIPGQPGGQTAVGSVGGPWQGGLPPSGYAPPGSGVERWRPVMIAALKYAGINPTSELVALGLRRLAQESGGNERAVNNWDINAKRGDPSKGLMQNIGSAFPERARELAGRGIYDGFANIVASIRYTMGRYGSLEKGWGRPGGY
jgi:D-alanyl-D-alanine carboxypeptidase